MPDSILANDPAWALGLELGKITKFLSEMDMDHPESTALLEALAARLDKLEEVVAETEPITLAGVAVQLMLAYSLIIIARASKPDPARKARQAALLRNAIRGVIKIGDIDIRKFGGAFYTPDITA